MWDKIKSFVGVFFVLTVVVFLVLDAALAFYLGIHEGWQTGVYVGIPAYIALCLIGPFTPMLIQVIVGGIKDEIKSKIAKGKKYQY